jgi:hypothetical protein
VRLSIMPAGGGVDTAPNRGITVRVVAPHRVQRSVAPTSDDP